jgi:hypothetical protein
MSSFSIFHWLIVIVILAVYLTLLRFLYVRSKRYPPASDHNPSGIAGWLLILNGAFFLAPIREAISMLTEYAESERLLPALASLTSWTAYKAVMWLAVCVFTYVCFTSAMAVFKGRTPSVLKKALIAIWATPALTLFSIVSSLIIFQNFSAIDAKSILFNVLIAAIWTAYLFKSKRVKNTYQVSAHDNGKQTE